MDKLVCKLSILFDGQFYIGLVEEEQDGKLQVSKHIFGADPSDQAVMNYILYDWNQIQFSPSIETKTKNDSSINPKRLSRLVRKEVASTTSIGTKSQQALKKLQEEKIVERKTISKEQKEEKKRQDFERRQEKKKEKHLGH
jgi:hypothetical protein